MTTSQDLVTRQFGPNAAAYAVSATHAAGESLARVVELVQPQPHWRALDIATGAGHMALALAPHVREMTASDITHEMLRTAERLARERGLANINFKRADAMALPFRIFSFDLVTCRIAPHHFARVDRFVAECARVLKPGGVLAIVDNIAPEDAAPYIDNFERLRDPSHVHCLTASQWMRTFVQNGFAVEHHEALSKRVDFATWINQQKTPPGTARALARMLLEAPAAAAWWLRPDVSTEGAVTSFRLTEGVFVSRMPLKR